MNTDPTEPLDSGIARYVNILRSGGVETSESCEGGPGHCSPEPFVSFFGQPAAGWHALSVAQDFGLPVLRLSREWSIQAGEPTGPEWRMIFRAKDQSASPS